MPNISVADCDWAWFHGLAELTTSLPPVRLNPVHRRPIQSVGVGLISVVWLIFKVSTSAQSKPVCPSLVYNSLNQIPLWQSGPVNWPSTSSSSKHEETQYKLEQTPDHTQTHTHKLSLFSRGMCLISSSLIIEKKNPSNSYESWKPASATQTQKHTNTHKQT